MTPPAGDSLGAFNMPGNQPTTTAVHVLACNAVNARLAELGRPQVHPSQRALVKETLRQLVAEGHADLSAMLGRADAAPPDEFGG